jgi:hypothetical protein
MAHPLTEHDTTSHQKTRRGEMSPGIWGRGESQFLPFSLCEGWLGGGEEGWEGGGWWGGGGGW